MPPRLAAAADSYQVEVLDAAEASKAPPWTASAHLVDDEIVISFDHAFCPVCSHQALPPTWTPPELERSALGLVPAMARTAEQIVVRCACREAHPGRPAAAAFGCGAAWSLCFSWDLSPGVGPVTFGPRPSEADLGFDAKLADVRDHELTHARSQAQGWSTVMAGLAGLLGATQIFAGRSFASALAPGWQDATGIVLSVTLSYYTVAAEPSALSEDLDGVSRTTVSMGMVRQLAGTAHAAWRLLVPILFDEQPPPSVDPKLDLRRLVTMEQQVPDETFEAIIAPFSRIFGNPDHVGGFETEYVLFADMLRFVWCHEWLHGLAGIDPTLGRHAIDGSVEDLVPVRRAS